MRPPAVGGRSFPGDLARFGRTVAYLRPSQPLHRVRLRVQQALHGLVPRSGIPGPVRAGSGGRRRVAG